MAIVEFKEVSRVYKNGEHEQRALDHVNLSLEEGKFIVVLGPSGAGKSTLLNMLGGLDSPTEGTIVVDGKDISTLTEGEQDVGFMTMSMVYFQPVDMAPIDQATAKENTDLHIEVDLTAKENGYAFPVDQWVPYLTIDFVIKDTEGKEVCSGSMMPMPAQRILPTAWEYQSPPFLLL